MNSRLKIRGKLWYFVKWPLYLSLILILMSLVLIYVDVRAGLISLAFVGVFVIIALVLYFTSTRWLTFGLVDFATGYGQVQRQLLKQFVLPYALLDDSGRFVWQNEAFLDIFKANSLFKKSVASIMPELTKDKLPIEHEEHEYKFSYDGRDYRVNLRRIDLSAIKGRNMLINPANFEGALIAMFLFDETELNEYIKRNRDESLVTGIIYLDNYDEALESALEVRQSLLAALVDRKINKYFQGYDAIVRKTETDKYFVVMKRKAFDEMCAARVDILEEVKTVNIGNDIAITLSIGFGLEGTSFQENTAFAKSAIDLALGRGGDQAVVKTPAQVTYFGGKSQQIEKNTRVKARVKAHALKEIIESRERIIVMGHAMPDVDSFGSAVGIFRASAFLGKKCHIVINEVTMAIRAMLDDFIASDDYEPGTIIDSQEAMGLVDANTVLVVVDTNKPSITECPELLNICKAIVVLDHHRQGTERIENAVLSYIEPYASSACEMVAEILQYIGDGIKLKSIEADCMYSGIMIDTNNFMTKTGVRTFEAAAFLRRNGADVTRVRKIFRNDFEDYRIRAAAVQAAELYRNEFAISILPAQGIDSPTIVGAQAANELLNINSVKASFVMTEHQGKVYVSARSIDEINVQLIMERMGGGGHMNTAGAQVDDKNALETIDWLKEIIDTMIEEGAI